MYLNREFGIIYGKYVGCLCASWAHICLDTWREFLSGYTNRMYSISNADGVNVTI